MTDPTLFSDAAAGVTWLAEQPRSLWRPRAVHRERVGLVCELSRSARVGVERALRDIEPSVPARLGLRQAADAVVWCNTVDGRMGHRARTAISVLPDEDAGQLRNDFVAIRELAGELREELGGDPNLLTAEQRAMVEENMGLVRWAVNRWASNYPPGYPFTREDAFQEATLGLMAAVRLYDPSRGTLANYASSHLYAAISNGEGRMLGSSYRSARRRKERITVPLSLDGTTSNAFDEHDGYPDWTRDVSAEDSFSNAEWFDAGEDAVVVARRVCRTEMEEMIFDAVAVMSVGDSFRSAFAPVCERFGVTHECVRTHWHDLRARLADELGGWRDVVEG